MLQPFQIAVPDPVLEDLARRLAGTRLAPDGVDRWDAGMSPAYLRTLVAYWRERYDWRAHEAQLNRFHHLRGEVDGTLLHVVHEKGRGPSPLPLLLVHGFPDSFYRFHKLIPLLTDPAAHGGDPTDAFDVVVPSLPGYAFSAPREEKGGLFGFAELLHVLMTQELGYPRYGAHGGDWGSIITSLLARSHAQSLAAIHLTDVPFLHALGKQGDLSAAERSFLEQIQQFRTSKGAYAMIQGTRPRTAAVALNDSPAGLAAWIVEKFQEWSDCGGDPERCYTKDELLTNVMLYWVTGTIESSFQPYHDVMSVTRPPQGSAPNERSGVPAGFAIFPKDLSTPPREWAERFFDVRRWTEARSGGHFAALEAPAVLARELREFFRPFRRA
ncbi:MAG: epoxide hydrolase family protein [Anaeromyxobacteraceae bacterium]